MKRLREKGLEPNDEANRSTLIRRVSLDLTGLPPKTGTLKKYLSEASPDWYEKLVDELLQSPQYAEHMTRFWLDAARYGDTHGLHLDNYREMWLYRDWVIQAFHENKSYRDFTIEQLAGDLLETPTEDQLIATGFNRAHVTTNEGGSITEEVYVRNVVDRVATTGIVFMGLTTGCAQCHDHKFDPISQKEFYQLFAFFNSLDANPMDGNRKDHAPVLRRIDEAGKKAIAEFEQQIKDTLNEQKEYSGSIKYVDPNPDAKPPTVSGKPLEFNWVDDQLPPNTAPSGPWNFTPNPDDEEAGKAFREVNVEGFQQHFFVNSPNPIRVQKGDRLFAYVYLDPKNPPTQIMLQYNDGSWEHRIYWGQDKINFGTNGTVSRQPMGDLPKSGEWIRLEFPVEKVGFGPKPKAIHGMAFSQQDGRVLWGRAGVVSKINQSPNRESFAAWQIDMLALENTGLPKPVDQLLRKPAVERSTAELQKLREHFLLNVHPLHSAKYQAFTKKKDQLQNQLTAKRNSYPTTLIWREKPEPKKAFLLKRGEYDLKGEEVERLTPSALPPFDDRYPRNRLGLAQWLVDPDHPLTARVAVNRFWQQVMGTGIVETSEDFGAQGTVPSHPDLLDWLAVDFMENGWDVRRMLKSLVMSRAYRQSSKTSPEKLRLDPANRLVSRGPRYRLDAEMLRDQALSVSGLLQESVGGPSVKPPQPGGLWYAVGYTSSNTARFKQDTGPEKLYRRSLYTFWKRTSPPPQMSTFDAPSRESCSVRRERTNTPLQALLLMNEPQYVEAARHLATRALEDVQEVQEPPARLFIRRLDYMYSRTLGRMSTLEEQRLLLATYDANLAEFENAPEAARKLISVGDTLPPQDHTAPELAAYTMIANLIMNMDEFVNKN